MSGGLTRRGAVAAAAAVSLASCGGDDPPARRGPAPGSGVGLLNSVLAFEHAAVAAYAALTELLTGPARAGAEAIAEQEREHVRRLTELIEGLGGVAAASEAAASYERSLPRLRDDADALLLARDLEERLVRAHLDALSKLPAGPLRRAAAGLATSEAEHLVVVRDLSGERPVLEAFVTGTS